MPSPARARQVAVEIVRTLRDAGHVAYLAGGCVRDELLGEHPKDYDVATDATPDEVRGLFQRVNEVGASFGVLLVTISRVTVEVATFREEGEYTDRRRPDEVRFADALSDARRRDFTINALFLDPLAPSSGRVDTADRPPFPVQGEIIDYVGGLEDLHARVIRAVGDPDRRLAEDDLRALRAARFAARFRFEIDPATAGAIRRHAGELVGVSRERIGHEIRRMLEHPTRGGAASLMHELELVGPALLTPRWAPQRADSSQVPTLEALPPDAGFELALAAWALDCLAPGDEIAALDVIESRAGEAVAALREALCLTNDERRLLTGCLEGVPTLERDWHGLNVSRQKRLAVTAWFPGALALVRARRGGIADALDRRLAELVSTPSGLSPEPLLSGDDLIRLGVPAGPSIGRLLEEIYDAQLEDRVRTREEGEALIRRLTAD